MQEKPPQQLQSDLINQDFLDLTLRERADLMMGLREQVPLVPAL